MKTRILIGALAATSLAVSCAAEPEESGSTPAVEEVIAVVGEPTHSPVEAGISGGNQGAVDQIAPSPTTSAPSPDAKVPTIEPADGDATEPTPQATVPGLPEPGGPWVDPRQPDSTKTVPPPRR